MKKCLPLVLVALCFNLFSQEEGNTNMFSAEKGKESKIAIGVEGGFSLNKFRVSGPEAIGLSFQNKASFVAGINVTYSLFHFLSLKASINYENKGAKYSFSDFYYGAYNYTYNFNYLNLPIVASYQHQFSKLTAHIGVGPNISFLLGSRISLNSQSESITNESNRLDVGLVGEAGASYAVLPKILVDLSFREVFGLLNVANEIGTSSLKTNSMAIVLGVKYKL